MPSCSLMGSVEQCVAFQHWWTQSSNLCGLCFGIMFPVVTGGLKTRDREPGSTWPFLSGPSQSHVSCAPALLCRMAASPVHLPFSATWPVLGRNSPVCVVSALPTLYGCLTRSETPGWVIKPLSQAYWKYTVLSKSLPNKGFKRLLDSPPRSGVRSSLIFGGSHGR